MQIYVFYRPSFLYRRSVEVFFPVLFLILVQLPRVVTATEVERSAKAYLRALQQATPEARAAAMRGHRAKKFLKTWKR